MPVTMPRTRIKICGITRPADAAEAAYLGADAIGLVLSPGMRRSVSAETATQIIAALPAFVTPVGLFVDAAPQTILQIARDLGLRHVQLHGNETATDVAALKGLRVIKAIAVRSTSLEDDLATWRSAIPQQKLENLAGLILDSAIGGSGIENDWTAIGTALAAGAGKGLPPLIAAGGLTPRNVATVVRKIHPWAVDVSSGVESEPGIKSDKLMAEFLAAVTEADDA
jgi:phosphoribosylanthranilate isomerase